MEAGTVSNGGYNSNEGNLDKWAQQGIEIRFLEDDEYYLLDEIYDGEGVARLDPNFSRVVAAIKDGKVIGIMVMQMVLHTEPIIIKEEWQGKGLWRDMAEMLDGYLTAIGIPGAYTQPMRDETKAIAGKMGYTESEHPLWVKIYNHDFRRLVPEGTEF